MIKVINCINWNFMPLPFSGGYGIVKTVNDPVQAGVTKESKNIKRRDSNGINRKY